MHSYVGPKHLHSHLCQDGALRASVGPCQYHRGTSFSGGVTEKKEEELPPGSDHSSGSAWGASVAGQVRSPRPLLFSFEALPPADSSGGRMEADHSQYPFPISLLFLRKNLLYKKERDGHALPFPHQLSHCMMTPFMPPHLSTCRGSSREVSGKRLKGMNFTVCIL